MRHVPIRTGKLILVISITAALLFFIGCNRGGGGGALATPENAQTGIFIDSPVDGLEYSTPSWNGITGDAGKQGSFFYQEGEQVTFSIGTVVLGSTKAKGIITPLDLGYSQTIDDTRVLNIARLLLSLDQDKDPSNGITIPEKVRTALTGINIDLTNLNLDNTAGIKEMYLRLNGLGIYAEEVTGLVSAQDAQLHLENTLLQIQAEAEQEQALSSFISSPFGNVIMVMGQSLFLQETVYGGRTPYTFLWNFEGSSPFSYQKDPGTMPFNTIGSYILNCSVKDAAGTAQEDSRLITVLGPETQTGPFATDSFPSLAITYPPDGTTLKTGEPIRLLALLYNGDVPLIYRWSTMSSVPGNSFSMGNRNVDYISPRTYLITQEMTFLSPGTYTMVISVQDTNTGGRFPDTHAASVIITIK